MQSKNEKNQLNQEPIQSDSSVWAWGVNVKGNLGNGTTNYSSVPIQVSLSNKAIGIAAAYLHSLAVNPDRTVSA